MEDRARARIQPSCTARRGPSSGGRARLERSGDGRTLFAGRPGPKRLNINPANFWKRKRITYFIDQHKVVVQRMEQVRWYQILVGFHLRSGYRHEDFLSDLWAATLDLVCIAFLLWIASGIYMWWKIRPTRFWGMTALVGGFVCFASFFVNMSESRKTRRRSQGQQPYSITVGGTAAMRLWP